MSAILEIGGLSEGWGAHLLIEEARRGEWTESFAYPFDPWIEKMGSDLFLRSKRFEGCTSAAHVRPLAIDLLRMMLGAVSLSGPPQEAQLLGIVRVDAKGHRHITAFLEGVAAIALAGSFDRGGEPPARIALERARDRSYLEDALSYFGDVGGWFDLYKCIESAEKWAGGEHQLAKLQLVPSKELKLAKASANNARHAKAANIKLKRTLTYLEARELVRRLIVAALTQPIAGEK